MDEIFHASVVHNTFLWSYFQSLEERRTFYGVSGFESWWCGSKLAYRNSGPRDPGTLTRPFWDSYLGPFWDPFGTLLGFFWNPFGSLLGPFGTLLVTFWDPFATLLGPYWDPFGTLLEPFWGPFTNLLGPFWDPFTNLLGPFCDPFLFWCI